MLLCKDCISYDVDRNEGLCYLAARKLPTDLVHGDGVGDDYIHMARAKTQRRGGFIASRLNGLCGKEGRFFVATSAGGRLAAMEEREWVISA